MEPNPQVMGIDTASDYGSDFDVRSVISDYGSEFNLDDLDDTLIGDLLVHIAASAPKAAVYPSIEGEDGDHKGSVLRGPSPTTVLRVPKRTSSERPARGTRSASVEVEYDSSSRQSWSVPREEALLEPVTESLAAAEPSGDDKDARSPLECFRTKPKKPLSVTDLVSPAWCELQYWYTLSKFGRKPRTAAMQTGSRIHQGLEEEVHAIVPVSVKSKEDLFGLRIWNTIQGLRTLRDTGLTRELEVWGAVEGQVVNGIIDELSYTCPDPEFEERIEMGKAEKSGGTLPLRQLSIEQAFPKVDKTEESNVWVGALELDRLVYIADVKTRGVPSLPTGSTMRPTWMQLMLYRKLLESLFLNTVDAETVFARYSLAPLEPFTNVFMREVGRLMDFREEGTVVDENPFSILQPSEIQSHPNLLSLWSLMITEFQYSVSAISDVLRAEFRYSKTGKIIGSELTVYDSNVIGEYLTSEMQWWRGERSPKGVEIEEAFKCRVCDFAEECSWRRNKVEEATEKHRLRAQARGKSAV